MKKLFLVLSMIVMTFTVLAQQGSWYIGGAVGYGSDKSESGGEEEVSTEWAFAPEVGTFVKDDLQLGIFLGIGGGNEKVDGDDQFKYSLFSPTIYGRKFFKITDNFSTFAGLYLNIGTGGYTDYSSGSSLTVDQSGFGVSLGLGVAYALSPRFTAVGQYGALGYQSSKSKFEGEEIGSDNSFRLGVNTVGYGVLPQGNGSGSVFNIGIYYTFKPAN
jgi:hypothetical protein